MLANFAGVNRPLCALLVMFAAAVVHGQELTRPAVDMSKYTSPSWRWSISYPAGWMVDGKDPDLVRIRPPAGNALCSIHSGAMDRFNNVDELTDFLLADNERFFKGKGQKFTVLSRRKITLSGSVVGNDVLADMGLGVRSRRIYAIADGRGFAVDCEGYAKDWSRLEAAFQRVMASFAVSK
jgi:hypothetical protein